MSTWRPSGSGPGGPDTGGPRPVEESLQRISRSLGGSGAGVSRMCLRAIWTEFSPSKTRRPVRHS